MRVFQIKIFKNKSYKLVLKSGCACYRDFSCNAIFKHQKVLNLFFCANFMLAFIITHEIHAQENANAVKTQKVTDEASSEIKKMISHLDHEDYQKRKFAHQFLLNADSSSIPLLQKEVMRASPEKSSRILLLVEHHLQSDKKEYYEPATVALDHFLDSENQSLIAPATQIWNRHINLIERRAISQIINLGGMISTRDQRFNPNAGISPAANIERISKGVVITLGDS